MRKSRLIVACVFGLVAAPSAFAEFVEGTINLEALRNQPSMAQTDTQMAVKGSTEESIFSLLAAQQQELADRKGVAGRSGAEMGAWTPSASRYGEGSIYDQIRSETH